VSRASSHATNDVAAAWAIRADSSASERVAMTRSTAVPSTTSPARSASIERTLSVSASRSTTSDAIVRPPATCA
jgi:hypothetical protein